MNHPGRRRRPPWYLTGTLAMLLAPAVAVGQELLVHLPLDGSIANAGSAGEPELVGTMPATVQGHIGSAMKFDGQVIAVPVDLSPDQVSRLTVTAWVRADADAADTNHWIVSSGAQSTTPFLRLLKRRQGIKGELRGGRASLVASDFSPAEEWVFIAGTVDIPAQQLGMHQGVNGYQLNGIRTDSLYDASNHVNPNDPDTEPRSWVFIGARTFNTSLGVATGIAIDDVRIYADLLSAAQIADLRDGGGQTLAADDSGVQLIAPPAGIGSGSDTGSRQPALTSGDPEQRSPPDREAIAQQATDVARAEARERAAEREAARRQTLRQAEEERQAQEQEDAGEDEPGSVRGEGRIGVGTLTVEAGEIPEGIRNLRIASGDGHRTAVSGWSDTAGQLRVDLRRYAMHTIAWYEENDRPCEVVITAYAPGTNTYGVATARNEACNGDGGNRRSRRVVSLQPDGGVITSLAVCFRGAIETPGLLTIPPDGRVKGLDIVGQSVAADGKLEDGPFSSDASYRPNCQERQNFVACPAGQVATGLVNHLQQTSSDNYYISGLQLICREVVD